MAEAMVAILFISIALFGYISLHLRLIHSGGKLEVRQVQREAVGDKVVQAMVDARYKGMPAAVAPTGSSASSGGANQQTAGTAIGTTTTPNRPGFNAGGDPAAVAGYNDSGFWGDTVPPKGYYDFQGWSNTTRPPGYDNFSWANTTNPSTQADQTNVFAEHPDAYASIGGMAYSEAFINMTTNGMPQGLTQVTSTINWQDREGQHSYLVDGYERQALPFW